MANPQIDAPATAKRTRKPAVFAVERYDENTGTFAVVPATNGGHRSTADAMRAVKKLGEGDYRVVRVCWQGSVKTETKTVTKLI